MWSPKPWVGYAVAVTATAIVVLARAASDRWFGPEPVYLIPFLLPIALAGWLGGLRCGLFTTALNALLVVFLFIEPVYSFGITNPGDGVRAGVFVVVGVVITYLNHQLHGHRRRAEYLVRESLARQEELEHEVADRRKAERLLSGHREQLLESEQRLRLLLESLPQLVWTCTTDGGCDYLSRQWVEYTGVPEGEQLGDGWTATIHPDDLPRLRSCWGQAVRDRTAYDIEFRIRGASGEYRWFKTRSALIASADGVGKWFGTCTDIHDRKVAEEDLRQANATLERRVAERTVDLRASDERFRLAAGAAGVGVWEWNLHTNRIHWNAHMFKLYHIAPTPDGVVPYEAWSGAVLPEDLPGQVETLRATIDRLGSGTRSFRIRLPDGRCRHIEAAEQVRVNADGLVEWVVGTNLDVTDRLAAEDALRASERRFRAVFHTQFQFIGLMSTDGVLLEANRTALAAAGVAEDQVLGRPFWETAWWTHDTAQQDRLREAVRRAASGQQDRFEASHPLADGTLMWVDFSLTPHTEGGRVVLLIPEGRDITERRRGEEALRASEEKFRVLFEQSSDAHLIFADGGIVDCNATAVGMLRCGDKRAVLNTHPAALSPEFQPDGRRSLDKGPEMEAIARRDGHHRFDWVHRRADGEDFPCEVSLTAVALHGRPAVLIVWHDLTERKRAEVALRTSEERLRLALRGAKAGVWECTLPEWGSFWSPEYRELYGFTDEEEAHVEKWRSRVHPDDLPRIESNLAAIAEPGRDAWQQEFRLIVPGRGVRWILDLVRVIRSPEGHPTRIGGVNIDITDRKRAEEQVLVSLKEKEILLKEIHHRVKNNLQIISALLHLQSASQPDLAVRGLFEESRGRVKSMALIHERLYRSGNLAGVDLAEYVRQLAADLYRTYRVSHNSVRFDLDVTVPPLTIDVAIPCGLLLNEMLTNCLKHAFRDRAAGVIAVGLHRTTDGDVVLSVSDDGVGYPPAFDFRTTNSFGFQLIHTLADQLNGHATLTGGPGATVAVTFPTPKEVLR